MSIEQSALPARERGSRFAEACHMPPFSNGTEGDAWTSKWCSCCANDHGIHLMSLGKDEGDAPTCDILMAALVGSEQWPEAWLPEPDDGRFALPSRMVCLAFRPCEPCGGDPGAESRAERVATVVDYWKENR